MTAVRQFLSLVPPSAAARLVVPAANEAPDCPRAVRVARAWLCGFRVHDDVYGAPPGFCSDGAFVPARSPGRGKPATQAAH